MDIECIYVVWEFSPSDLAFGMNSIQYSFIIGPWSICMACLDWCNVTASILGSIARMNTCGLVILSLLASFWGQVLLKTKTMIDWNQLKSLLRAIVFHIQLIIYSSLALWLTNWNAAESNISLLLVTYKCLEFFYSTKRPMIKSISVG